MEYPVPASYPATHIAMKNQEAVPQRYSSLVVDEIPANTPMGVRRGAQRAPIIYAGPGGQYSAKLPVWKK
jgi:hypothetical protein